MVISINPIDVDDKVVLLSVCYFSAVATRELLRYRLASTRLRIESIVLPFLYIVHLDVPNTSSPPSTFWSVPPNARRRRHDEPCFSMPHTGINSNLFRHLDSHVTRFRRAISPIYLWELGFKGRFLPDGMGLIDLWRYWNYYRPGRKCVSRWEGVLWVPLLK